MAPPPDATERQRSRKSPLEISSRIRTLDEELHSILHEVETQEKEGHTGAQIRLDAVLKRYRYGRKTMRIISISQRFNNKEEIEKYDVATAKGRKYCIVTIRFLSTKWGE